MGEQFDRYTAMVTTPDGRRLVVEGTRPKSGHAGGEVVIRSLAGAVKYRHCVDRHQDLDARVARIGSRLEVGRWPDDARPCLRRFVARLDRWQVLAAIAAVFGAIVWLTLVPSDDLRPETPLGYWLLCGGGSLVLGAASPRKEDAQRVGAAIVAPALLLALWTAPRGDEDGLWILWLPLLFGFGALLVGIASVASWTASWVRARP